MNTHTTAIIAEKPSVARELAGILGATEKHEGYLSGNHYEITWALGHLIGLGMPEDYGVAAFQPSALPIVPDNFLLQVRKVKTGNGYVTDHAAKKQLKIIESIFRRCDHIIVATDAGREGELIFRYIYEYLRCTKPFQRLWISSLTEKSIRQGFDALRPGTDFDGLYHAARCRSEADWLVGINASQALSIAAGDGVYSLGRVQTPTLALICQRYLEHTAFNVQPYWQIQLLHRKEFLDFKSLSGNKWMEKKPAEDALKSVLRANTATVTNVVSREVSEHPPLLFDLTGLQKQANKLLGLSAEETLNIAQSLYEKKFISYPRTGSKYITADLWTEIPRLVRALEAWSKCKDTVNKMKWGHFNKRIVNELKVTDHHGLLTTEKIPSALTAKESAIYDLIALRLLESVSPLCSKQVTDITLQVMHHEFTLKGSNIIEPGWRAVKGNFADDESELLQQLPELSIGNELKINQALLSEKHTRPPVLYTEAGLLSAMENAGNTLPEKASILKDIGIGTPATRAAIIETLFTRDYIRRDKKNLIPTSKGLKVFDAVRQTKIADVLMTAEWEEALYRIEHNEAGAEVFQKEIQAFTRVTTQELLNLSLAAEKLPQLNCPKCRENQLLIRDNLVKCPGETCKWIQFRKVCGVQLSLDEITRLVTTGKSSLIKGMKSKSGKSFEAYISLNSDMQSEFVFEKRR